MEAFTARLTLRLATPRGIAAVLGELGIGWAPVPMAAIKPSRASGLYAWVDGGGSACEQCGGTGEPRQDLLDGGVLYYGVGGGLRGVLGRLVDERNWIGLRAEHGHGMAMHRRRAVPVAAVVTVQSTDLSWLCPPIVNADGASLTLAWLQTIKSKPKTLLRAAEHIVIRAGIHLGDVGAPVNSSHSGAWSNDHPADWAAWASVQRLMLLGVNDHPEDGPASFSKR